MTSRIHRGFHRIGVVLIFPVLVLSGVAAGSEAWQAWSNRGSRAEPAGAVDPFSSFDRLPVVQPGPHTADYSTAIFLLVTAVALYAAARAIGWVLDGFLSPGPRP